MPGGPYVHLYERFTKNLGLLVTYAGTMSQEMLLAAQAPWMTPDPGPNSVGATWDGKPYSLVGPTGLPAAYDRTDMNAGYIGAMQTAGSPGGGRVGDVRVAKTQNDYLAAQERAYSLRTASAPRCLMHAAARMAGHADANGVFAVVSKNLDDVLAAAWQDNPNFPLG